MSGVSELILVDADTVEVSNLNRLPLKESFVGMKKTQAAKDFLSEIRKLTRLEIHNLRLEKSGDCQVLRGAIFCCTDNLRSQQLICAYCKKNALAYQRIGYDGTVLNVSKTFPLSFEEIKDDGGYTTTPSWVIPAVFAAAAGVSSRAYKELCLMDDIGKLHIQNSSHVPEKILDEARQEREDEIVDNIHDYIPDSYGCCEDCNRVDPDNSDYGYCPDCDSHYSEDEIEEIKEKAKEGCINDIISQLETREIEDSSLRKAIEKYLKTRRPEKCLA
jgi:molybdopterin/thiamine biosynthesis adenylyltransferase